jgi:hypothetical protein
MLHSYGTTQYDDTITRNTTTIANTIVAAKEHIQLPSLLFPRTPMRMRKMKKTKKKTDTLKMIHSAFSYSRMKKTRTWMKMRMKMKMRIIYPLVFSSRMKRRMLIVSTMR